MKHGLLIIYKKLIAFLMIFQEIFKSHFTLDGQHLKKKKSCLGQRKYKHLLYLLKE